MVVKKRKKRRFTIHFDMGIGGVLGLGIVSFCIFLWMFLLGVWSGQTVLLPSEPGKGPAMLTRMASDLWLQGKSTLKEGIDSGLQAVGGHAEGIAYSYTCAFISYIKTEYSHLIRMPERWGKCKLGHFKRLNISIGWP